MRRPGEISATKAARLLECSDRTVRRWCIAVIDDRQPTRITYARRDATGRYWVRRAEIDAIASATEAGVLIIDVH